MDQVVFSLSALILMEIVLGIDNIVFIAILAGSLPEKQQFSARAIGLTLALVMRVLLLFAISWMIGLTRPLFTVLDHTVSLRDLILLIGGIFLVTKATVEIFKKMEGDAAHRTSEGAPTVAVSLTSVVVQIVLLDLVFSIDSVITAVGMVRELWMMVTAVAVAIVIMFLFAGTVGDFVNRHPSVKMLALSFLILIGVLLIAEGSGQHINRGYIYFAMFYALAVELLNMRVRHKREAAAG